MNAQNTVETQNNPLSKQIVTGLILIAIGAAFLLSQILKIEWQGYLIMGGLSTIFLAGGLLTRNEGWLIPGGILGGIALGSWGMQLPLLAEVNEGGIFMASFAAGWAVVVLSSLLIGKPQWWALIPGGIMAVIGVGLLAGGVALTLLEFAGKFGWPLILIIVGAYVIFRKRNA
jgi:hypothetical protein